MRHGLFTASTLLLLASLAGCRLPGWDGPISQSLVDCRKLSRDGVAAMERGEQSQAEALLAKAVRACPSDTEARRNYAEVLWQRGAQNEAIVQMEAAAKSTSDNTAFRIRLAEMYLAAGKLEKATLCSAQVLEADPKSATAWALHGRVLKAVGQPQQALAAELRALSYDPRDRKILLDVAELYRQLNQPDRALQTLQSLADTYSPGDEPQNVLYLTGVAHLSLGRHEEAVASLQAAAQRDKPNAELLCRLGEAQLLAGHPREAATAAGQALVLSPQHQGSRELLERCQIAQQPQRDAMLR